MHKVVEWNRDRNGLRFDPHLEARMLSEEAHEFFLATDIVNAFKEAADFRFVFLGTCAKFYHLKWEQLDDIVQQHEIFIGLKAWAEQVTSLMEMHLASWLAEYVAEGVDPSDATKKMLEVAFQYVCIANTAKGNELVGGKVVKGPNYRAPEPLIRAEFLKIRGDA